MKTSTIFQQGFAAMFAAVVLLFCPLQLAGQPATPVPAIKVVLLRGGASGLSAKEADSFYSSLQGELAQFASLKVYSKPDLARGLSKEEIAALNKCSDLSCMESYARKAGMERMLLIRITKKNNTYQFQSDEYDAVKFQKLSDISENEVCETGEEVEHFVKAMAIKVGQNTTHDSTVPESLQESKSNLWWYVGGAATVGVAAGVYLSVSHKKSTSTSPTSLPLPPEFP